jgi:hypothetical protein
MTTKNPSNPYTADDNHTSKRVQMPVSKAEVLESYGMPDGNGFHTARISVYGDETSFVAPVITPMIGSVWVPKEDDDVAVIFNRSGEAFIIGSWYALDRVDSGDIDLPDYEIGDLRLGNESGSHVTINNDGSIKIQTSETQPINIDHQSATAFMSADQSVGGDDQYYKINFDTDQGDENDIFIENQNYFKILSDGDHTVKTSIEIPLPGQNNRYTIALFRNGSLFKRKNRQSAVNDELSVDLDVSRSFDNGDIIDVRLRQDSGSAKTVNSAKEASEFSIKRHGI